VNDDRTIKTTWQLVTESRDAVRQTRDMISAVDALAEREKRLTEAANKRVDARREAMEVDERARKIAPELYERELSAEDRYQKKLRERIDMLRENTRLQEDLRRVQVRSISEMVAAMDSASRDTLAVSRREQLAKVSAFAQYGIGAGDVLSGDTRGRALEAAGYSRRDEALRTVGKTLPQEVTERRPNMMESFWTDGRIDQFVKFAGAVAMIDRSLSAATKSLTTLNNPYMSGGRQAFSLLDEGLGSVPVVGGAYRGFKSFLREAEFGGEFRAMTKAREQYEMGKPIDQLQIGRIYQEMDYERQMGMQSHRATVAASVASGLNAPMLAAQSFGIGGAGYRMVDQRMSGPSQEIIKLRGELDKAKYEQMHYESAAAKLSRQYDEMVLSISRIEKEKKFESDREITDRDEAGGMYFGKRPTDLVEAIYAPQIKAIRDKMDLNLTEQEKVRQRANQLRESGVGIQTSIREQQNQRLLGELDVTRERVESRIDARQQFSGMGPADQMAIAMAVNQAKTRGYETLTEEQRDLLKGTQLTSRFARDQERDWSARNPNLAGIEKQIFPQGEDTDSLMQKQRKLEQDLAKEKQSALEEAAKDAADEQIKSMESLLNIMTERFITGIEKIKEELSTGSILRRIMGAG